MRRFWAGKLYQLGFSFDIIDRGSGSGGDFIVGRFKNDDREIVLWFRFELGGVSYRKADIESSHAKYMQALGRERTASYPGFGHGDSIAGFRHLLADLEYCDSFLSDNGNAFYNLIKNYKYEEPPKGLAALSRFEQ